MRDGWVYELVDRCGWGGGRGALGYVICDLHITLLLEKGVQAGSTGATLVCVVQHSRNSL